jgi:DNA polymerase-3 subunit alpha
VIPLAVVVVLCATARPADAQAKPFKIVGEGVGPSGLPLPGQDPRPHWVVGNANFLGRHTGEGTVATDSAMGSGMIDEFVARKHGRTEVKYDHPVLEPILKDTYGVILYQEQVMRISMDMGGFTAGQADGLRKAMGKKVPEEIEKQRDKFLDGAKAKSIDRKLAEKVFNLIVQFGGYGFNKSHAGAYGVVSYRTAYLKANHPLEYATAILNGEIGHSAIGKEDEESKLVSYIQDAERMNIKILPPDVQTSQAPFSVEGNDIRFGLEAIKNVGSGAVESIVSTRTAGGPFTSWDDFINRIDLHAANRKVLESLIKAGAFDCFGTSRVALRSELMARLDQSLSSANSRRQELAIGQGLLFEASAMSAPADPGTSVEPWSEHTALSFEKEVLGFYFSGHPLAQHQHDLVAYSQYRLDKLPQASPDPRSAPLIRLAGMITSAKKMVTKEKKEPYARFKMEDLHGEIEAVVFPKSYKNGLSRYVVPNSFVVIKGKLSGRDTENELLVEEMMTIEEAKRKLVPFVGAIHLKISSAGLEDGILDTVRKIIDAHPGRSPVVLDVSMPGQGEYFIETEFNVKYGEPFLKAIEKVLGDESWDLQSV